jgi:hypothetical protein
MAEFQEFLQYFKQTLILKCTTLINSEFKQFEENYIKFVNNTLQDTSDSDNDKRQDLSSTSDSEHNDSESDDTEQNDSNRESSPERD